MSNIEGFPDCCGLEVITHFYSDKCFQNLKEHQQENIDDFGSPLSTILVLTGRQKKRGHKFLVKQGYKIIQTFYNPKHASVLYIYFKEEHPTLNPHNRRFNRKLYRVTHNKGMGYDENYTQVVYRSGKKKGRLAYPKGFVEEEEALF